MTARPVDGDARVNNAVLFRARGYMTVNLVVVKGSLQQMGLWVGVERWGLWCRYSWFVVMVRCLALGDEKVDEPTYIRYPGEPEYARFVPSSSLICHLPSKGMGGSLLEEPYSARSFS